ncbi:hypothetical protein EYR40_002822 [Pleurotus pulmonarius]|nr:hypothetical protein EYR40_002822 [Pleurotus pulmonarius]
MSTASAPIASIMSATPDASATPPIQPAHPLGNTPIDEVLRSILDNLTTVTTGNQATRTQLTAPIQPLNRREVAGLLHRMLLAHQREYFTPTIPAAGVLSSANTLEFPMQYFFGLPLQSGVFINATLAQQRSHEAEPTAVHGSMIYLFVPQNPVFQHPTPPIDGPDHQGEPTATTTALVPTNTDMDIELEDRRTDPLTPPGLERNVHLPEVVDSDEDGLGSVDEQADDTHSAAAEEDMELKYPTPTPSPKQAALDFIRSTAFRTPSPISQEGSSMEWAVEDEGKTQDEAGEDLPSQVSDESAMSLSHGELHNNTHLVHRPPSQYGARKPQLILTRGRPMMRTLPTIPESSRKRSRSADGSETESLLDTNDTAQELTSALNYTFTQNSELNTQTSSPDVMPAFKRSRPDDLLEGQSSPTSVSRFTDTGFQQTGLEKGITGQRELEQTPETVEERTVNPADLNCSPNITVSVETTVTQTCKPLPPPTNIDLPHTLTPMQTDHLVEDTQGTSEEWSRYLQFMLQDEDLSKLRAELTGMLEHLEVPEWTTSSPFPTRTATPALSETDIPLSTTHSTSSEESLLFSKPSNPNSPVLHAEGIEASGPVVPQETSAPETSLETETQDKDTDQNEEQSPPDTQSTKEDDDSEMPGLESQSASADGEDEESTSTSEYSSPEPLPAPHRTPTIDPRIDFAKVNRHAYMMFNILLKLKDSHPGQSFVEVQTDCPDIWGFNDAYSTFILPMGVPIPPTTRLPLFSAKPPVGHPLTRLVGGDWAQRAQVTFKYAGPVDNHPLQRFDNALVDELDTSYGVWFDDGDLEIARRITRLCTSMHKEQITPEMWDFEYQGTTYSAMQRSLRTVNGVVFPPGVELIRRTHKCASTMDPQTITTATESFPSGDVLKPQEYEAAFGSNPWVTHYASPYMNGRPNWMFNPWVPYITYLRKARMETKFIIQSVAQYLLKSNIAKGTVDHNMQVLTADTRHYFYFHCHIFRYLDPEKVQLLELHQEMFFSMKKKTSFSTTLPAYLRLWDKDVLPMPFDIFVKAAYTANILCHPFFTTNYWSQISTTMGMASADLLFGVRKIGDMGFATEALCEHQSQTNMTVFKA